MRSRGRAKHSFSGAIGISAQFVALLCFIHLVQWLLLGPLPLGIVPRTIWGVLGIVFSPLLHGNAAHLAANATPLFILLVLLYWDHHYQPERTLSMIWMASGFGTWLIGRADSMHIGASSLIFGLVSYLIMSGFWMGRWRSVFVSLSVFILFGGIFYGVLPQDGPISWEGHLSGAIAGVWAARKNHLPD